ncbi:MAG TPA: DUF3048 domain-containing protein [Acidimicrobiia bacterium]|nr:DUF3048 domain-containing protein [Acidimicrobiia bacterium]
MARGRVALVLVAVLGVVGAAACGGGSGKHASKRSASAPSTTLAAPPVAPLTGLPDPSGQAAHRAALGVKIENTPQARPQSGLDVADVVYDEVVDGGITRFLAIFQSTGTDPVGPIRSVRPIDPSLVWPVGGIFAYSGGVASEVKAINAAPVLALDEDAAGTAMFRVSSRRSPHNLYGHPDKLWARGGKPVPPPPLFQYLPAGAVFAGQPVASFTVDESPDRSYDPTYTWDAASRTWKRAYGSRPFTMTDGSQIAPANVVVQQTAYSPSPGAPGAIGQTVGQGPVWVFTDGKVAQGQWIRSSMAQPAHYVDGNGAPILLAPGRTWVELAAAGVTLGG